MKRKAKQTKTVLDHEEKELLESFDRDEWKSVKNLSKEKAVARKIARRTLSKDTYQYPISVNNQENLLYVKRRKC